MSKFDKHLIKNQGVIAGLGEYFLNHYKLFPTYQDLQKDYFEKNPDLLSLIKDLYCRPNNENQH